MTKISFLFALFFAATLATPLVAADSQSIIVTGTGEVEAQPTRVEIDLNASGAAPLTGDALVKHRDAVRRTTEAFQQLQVKDLSIEPKALSINGGKTQFDISRSLRLALVGIDKVPEEQLMETIAKFLDTARDAGVTIGPSNAENEAMMQRFGMGDQGMSHAMVTFVVDDAEPAREQAYQKAFDQARARAARVAKLAGGTVGAVTNVEELGNGPATQASDESPQTRILSMIYGLGTPERPKQDSRLSSNKFESIPVRVSLRVHFEMHAASGAKP